MTVPPIGAPVNICGVSGAVGGFGDAGCAGGAQTGTTLAPAGSDPSSGNSNVTGDHHGSIRSGNTITAPISAPVNLCGVSLAVLGFASSACPGGAFVNPSCGCPPPTATPAATTASGTTPAGSTPGGYHPGGQHQRGCRRNAGQ